MVLVNPIFWRSQPLSSSATPSNGPFSPSMLQCLRLPLVSHSHSGNRCLGHCKRRHCCSPRGLVSPRHLGGCFCFCGMGLPTSPAGASNIGPFWLRSGFCLAVHRMDCNGCTVLSLSSCRGVRPTCYKGLVACRPPPFAHGRPSTYD